jgi:hypothetical protein
VGGRTWLHIQPEVAGMSDNSVNSSTGGKKPGKWADKMGKIATDEAKKRRQEQIFLERESGFGYIK